MSSTITVRGVKQRLSRAGIDHSALTITEEVVRYRQVDFNYTGPWQNKTMVTITGPKPVRRAASDVLYDAGFANAPYPDHDEWAA